MYLANLISMLLFSVMVTDDMDAELTWQYDWYGGTARGGGRAVT